MDPDWLEEQMVAWYPLSSYNRFLRDKAERRIFDTYAFFQPFNESTRSFLALYGQLLKTLKPGDVILDTWCRTGWQGEWLASLFPQQQVISIWEGNNNVLGYSGYQYWLPEEDRLPNLSIIFTHPDRPLPIRTDSIKLLVGLDSIHRYSQDTFLPECMRVVRPDGVLFFPHIHLTNTQPEPFFERGCNQLSGLEWSNILGRSCRGSDREAYIFGEPDLFDIKDNFTIKSNPNTVHYNGAALIAPKSWDGLVVQGNYHEELHDDHRLIVNPLLDIDTSTASVRVATEDADRSVREMLDRHPCYDSRLTHYLGHHLAPLECEVLLYATTGYRLGDISSAIEADKPEVYQVVENLIEREILQPAAVSENMARLQHYYGHLELQVPPARDFTELWTSGSRLYEKCPLLIDDDGESYDFESIDRLVRATAAWLDAKYDEKHCVLICSDLCPEIFIIVWASWLSGRVVVPVDYLAPDEKLDEIISQVSPAVCLGQRDGFIFLDSLAGDQSRLFSGEIESYLDSDVFFSESSDAAETAAILFTSGSSGQPKGVCLSQASLLYTGQQLAESFSWKSGDRVLTLGPLHTMSGLRNAAVAVLFPGASLVLPGAGIVHPPRLLKILEECSVTQVCTVPALLTSLASARELLSTEPRPDRLLQIIYTGYSLAEKIASSIKEWLNVDVLGYYGLTETGGICLAQPPGESVTGDLGAPVGAVAQIRGESGCILGAGETGELAIYSPGNASGYLQADTISAVRFEKGWVFTGDTALLNEDGTFSYVGRGDDQVKNRRGELVYLQVLENVARKHGGVLDCCALKVSDEIICAVILAADVGKLDWQDEVLNHIERCLGKGKLPDKMLEVPEIQRLSNGKVNRSAMIRTMESNH
jgi:acyl-CoA synthetase (AMP-forming)/AMP-acid ligase II